MYVCILDCAGNVVFHKNMAANPEALLRAIAPFREDIAIAVECMFGLLPKRLRSARDPMVAVHVLRIIAFSRSR
jgi:hypothetical protein